MPSSNGQSSGKNGRPKANGKSWSNGKTNGKKHRGNTQNLRPPWKPGESGNPNGRPKGVSLTRIVREMLAENDQEKARAICQKAIELAAAGDDKHVKEIWQRIDGKVPDRIAGHDGGPLVREVTEINMDEVCGRG